MEEDPLDYLSRTVYTFIVLSARLTGYGLLHMALAAQIAFLEVWFPLKWAVLGVWFRLRWGRPWKEGK